MLLVHITFISNRPNLTLQYYIKWTLHIIISHLNSDSPSWKMLVRSCDPRFSLKRKQALRWKSILSQLFGFIAASAIPNSSFSIFIICPSPRTNTDLGLDASCKVAELKYIYSSSLWISWKMSYPFNHLCYSICLTSLVQLILLFILANHHTLPTHTTTDYWSTCPSTHAYCTISLSLLYPTNSLEFIYSVQLHPTCPISQNSIILSNQYLLFS
jgi:hypothetical protein